MAIYGPDISSYQGYPNMSAVAAGGSAFVIIKATEGTGYVNPAFAATRDAAHAAGLIVGIYHFAAIGDPHAEAAFFLRVVGGLRDNEFLVLDFERPAADPPGWCGTWLDDVRGATGLSPFIYMNQSACHGSNWTGVANAGYPLWIAIYDGDPWTFQSQPYWGSPPLKQYTDAAQIPGIAGNVDRNSFNGTREQLLAYCKGGAPAPTPTPTGAPDMKLARTADTGGTIWLCTDLNVAATQDPALYASLKKVWGDEIAVTSDDIARMQDDAKWRLGQVVDAVIAKLPQAQPVVDPAAIRQAVQDAVNAALANVHVVTGSSSPSA